MQAKWYGARRDAGHKHKPRRRLSAGGLGKYAPARRGTARLLVAAQGRVRPHLCPPCPRPLHPPPFPVLHSLTLSSDLDTFFFALPFFAPSFFAPALFAPCPQGSTSSDHAHSSLMAPTPTWCTSLSGSPTLPPPSPTVPSRPSIALTASLVWQL